MLTVNPSVNPDASESEISAALDDPNTQVFQQALLSSSRTTQARTTLHEVQSRHNDIVAIERKVTELAQLFNELAIVVEAQEEQIEPIVQKADATQLHMKDAERQVSRAVKLAEAVRRKKWWCLFIILLIIIIIVVIVVVTQVVNKKTS
jgi:syntaxin 1B/2/3